MSEWGDEDAPLFFFLHGWADTGSTFQFVVDALQANWRVIAPDWRGFGGTRHRSDAYWFPDYLADLHQLMDFYSAHEPVRLVGHSMGANTCCLYAGAMPERVKAIVNIEGFGLPDSDPDDAPQRYRKWLKASQANSSFTSYPDFDTLAAKIRKTSPAMTEERASFVARQWAAEEAGRVQLRADPSHKRPNAVLYRRAEAQACWRRIEAPMLIISGECSSLASQFEPLHELPFPASECIAIPAVGHMIHFEAPQRLAQEIELFLRKTL